MLRGRPRGPLRRRGSPLEATPRPDGRPKACPSLPGHAQRRANSPGSRSGTLSPPFREQDPFSSAKARANSRDAVRAQGSPWSFLRIRREWRGLDAGLRFALQLQAPARPSAFRLLRVHVSNRETGTNSKASGKRRLRPRSRQKPRGGRGTGRRGGRATSAPRPRPSGGAQPHPRGGPRPASARAASPPVPALPPSSAQSPPAAAAPFVWAAGANQWHRVGGARLGQ